MDVYKMSFFLKRVSLPTLCLQFGAALFLLILAGAVQATEIEPENLMQRCRAELMPVIEKSLPGIEDLWFEDLGEVNKWLAGSDNVAGFSVLQVGCWNRKNGIVPVQLELYSDSGKESRRWFKVKLSGKEQVLLAKRDLARGEPVRSTDFSIRLVDCQSLRREVVRHLPDGMIYQLTCNLRAGELLPSKRLQPYRLIKRGELVQVLIQQGGVKISTRGVAMGNGTLKDIITIKNPTTRKFFQARVVGSGKVVVIY
ncbi:MAG: flagellar basal body P-ring formation protein FlgA [Deltaproteobacteria bacterium]|nr:flagellar basal body P-ring formation protein FlgA [Deltaproteobacteria bacterium]